MFRDPETQSNVQGTLESSRKRWPSYANDGYMMSQSYCNHLFGGMTILWCGYPPSSMAMGKSLKLNVELCLASFDYWYYWCTWWPNDPGCVFSLSYFWVASCCVLPTSPLSLWRGRGVSPCLQQGLFSNGWNGVEMLEKRMDWCHSAYQWQLKKITSHFPPISRLKKKQTGLVLDQFILGSLTVQGVFDIKRGLPLIP